MSFRIFLSHSTEPEENAVVWRVQMLAALEGLQVFVPPRTRTDTVMSKRIHKAIDQADCVLAILTSMESSAMQKELNYALEKKKVIVTLAEKHVPVGESVKKCSGQVFNFLRSDNIPTQVYGQIAGFLEQKKQEHKSLDAENRKTLRCIIAIFLGLLHLSRLAKE